MAGSINRVVVVGNLTRDPEVRQIPSGTTVCSLRIAVNDRVKDRDTGSWTDSPNYFTVSVFGAPGERCAQWLNKGRQVAVEGRLRWRQWETQDGQKREAIEIVADNVQFIGPREGGQGGGSRPDTGNEAVFDSTAIDVTQVDVNPEDDDIPF